MQVLSPSDTLFASGTAVPAAAPRSSRAPPRGLRPGRLPRHRHRGFGAASARPNRLMPKTLVSPHARGRCLCRTGGLEAVALRGALRSPAQRAAGAQSGGSMRAPRQRCAPPRRCARAGFIWRRLRAMAGHSTRRRGHPLAGGRDWRAASADGTAALRRRAAAARSDAKLLFASASAAHLVGACPLCGSRQSDGAQIRACRSARIPQRLRWRSPSCTLLSDGGCHYICCLHGVMACAIRPESARAGGTAALRALRAAEARGLSPQA